VPFPRGFAFGRDGRLFLGSGIGLMGEGDNSIVAFAPNNDIQPSLLVSDPELSPLDLAIAPNGNIVVSSEHPFGASDAVTTVREYDTADGHLVRVFRPKGLVEFRRPRGVRFGPDGNLYCVAQDGVAAFDFGNGNSLRGTLGVRLSTNLDDSGSARPFLLLGLNQALCGKFQHHYVTAAYLFVDMAKRTLTYAGAGHPPLLLWGGTSDGVRSVEENGLFLGKFEFARYSSVELPLESGGWALLYTDGISETTNPPGIEFGTERFREFLAAERSTSADYFADRLLEEISRWSARGPGQDLDDDITLVALHVNDA